MGNSFYKGLKQRLDHAYAKLRIRGKVTVPFVILFILLWTSGTSFLGIYLSRRLRVRELNTTRQLSILVANNLNSELDELREHARIFASSDRLVNAVINQDVNLIRQEVLPLKAILHDDWLGVFDRNQTLLFQVSDNELYDVNFLVEDTVTQVLAGADFSTSIGSDQDNLSLLTGTSPIKDRTGIVGGILLGVSS
jgi:hypothetical protein